MKNTVLKYGIYALISGFALFGLPFFFGMGIDNGYSELLGYTSIVLSLLFVYFGIREYRDRNNNGYMTLGKALKIGLLIALFSAIGVAIFDYIYTSQINPDFATEYVEYTVKKMEETMPPEEVKIKAAELERQMEDYGSPILMAMLMFVTVMIIGFIIALISGLILQRKKV